MRTIRTPEKRAEFLEALAECGNVEEARRQCRVSKNALYLWKKDDAEFSAAWEASLIAGGDALEEEAIRRARDGWDEPVWYKGKKVGTVRKFSDTLLIFLLKGLKPERYADRVEHTGADGGPIQIMSTIPRPKTG